jgi:hypothetical protein
MQLQYALVSLHARLLWIVRSVAFFIDRSNKLSTSAISGSGVLRYFKEEVQRAGFFGFERAIAEAQAGTHIPWAQDQVIGLERRGSRSRYLERASLTVARV